MSEAMKPIPEPDVTHDNVVELFPDEEKIDFSEVGPEIAVSYLFSELRHPTYASQHGTELAASVLALTSVNEKTDPASHEARLAELIRAPIEDELWDEKSENDKVFSLLEKLLRDNQVRSLAEQRQALLKLYNLRGSFPEMTTRSDDEWESVIERIFT